MFFVAMLLKTPLKLALDEAKMDELLQKIGGVCAQFQSIEMRITLATMSMVNERQIIGQAVVSKLSFSSLCDVFLALVRVVSNDENFISRCEESIKEASKIEQLRNQVIHSNVTKDADGNVGRFKMKVDRKKGVVFDFDNEYSETLEKLSSRMDDLTETLKSIQKEGQENGAFATPDKYV